MIRVIFNRAKNSAVKQLTLKFFGQPECKHCEEDIIKFEEGIPKGKIAIIRPDHNSAGFLTHYHIEVDKDYNKPDWMTAKELWDSLSSYRSMLSSAEWNMRNKRGMNCDNCWFSSAHRSKADFVGCPKYGERRKNNNCQKWKHKDDVVFAVCNHCAEQDEFFAQQVLVRDTHLCQQHWSEAREELE